MQAIGMEMMGFVISVQGGSLELPLGQPLLMSVSLASLGVTEGAVSGAAFFATQAHLRTKQEQVFALNAFRARPTL